MLIHIVASCRRPIIQGERLFKKLNPLMMTENQHAHIVQAYNYAVLYVYYNSKQFLCAQLLVSSPNLSGQVATAQSRLSK